MKAKFKAFLEVTDPAVYAISTQVIEYTDIILRKMKRYLFPCNTLW
jgi:hypothetical protein